MMERRNILVVGRSSFLASEFASRCADLPLKFVRHEDVDRADCYDDVGTVVTFAFSPELYGNPYDPAQDIDRKIAMRVRKHDIHYVMISSRRVYPAALQWNSRETMESTGIDAYGRNKAQIECSLRELLGGRLTVLRPGNVVGYEPIPGRTRFGAFLQNQLLESGAIRLTVDPAVRRDLISTGYLCRVLREVVARRFPGVFNVGAGAATRVGDAARWLIEGFGTGSVIVESDRVADEFQLDVTLLKETFGLACDPGELEHTLRDVGRRLAANKVVGVRNDR